MRPSLRRSIFLVVWTATALPADQAHTGGDCGAFEWDMTREVVTPDR